jgi:hypothetical protein
LNIEGLKLILPNEDGIFANIVTYGLKTISFQKRLTGIFLLAVSYAISVVNWQTKALDAISSAFLPSTTAPFMITLSTALWNKRRLANPPPNS